MTIYEFFDFIKTHLSEEDCLNIKGYFDKEHRLRLKIWSLPTIGAVINMYNK